MTRSSSAKPAVRVRRGDDPDTAVKAARDHDASSGQTAAQQEGDPHRHDGLTAMQLLKPTPEQLAVPAIAWPTVAFWLAAESLWVTTLVKGYRGDIPYPAALAVLSLTTYFLFTPMHDAAHGAIFSTRSGMRWANGVVGRACALAFHGPYIAFRYVHLQHHKHTNHSELDPDVWSGTGSVLLRPLRWASQDLHYYAVYLPLMQNGRPVKESAEAAINMGLIVSVIGAAAYFGHGWDVFWFWTLPSRLASTWLSFTFDFLPHRPHVSRGMLTATHVTSAWGTVTWPISILLAYQSYHNVHHLMPQIPFYRYAQLYWAHRHTLHAKGTQIKPVFPLFVES